MSVCHSLCSRAVEFFSDLSIQRFNTASRNSEGDRP